MMHEYSTWSKMDLTKMDLTKPRQNIDSLDEINNGNVGLKDEISNLKDIVIKHLQEENQNLWQKCNKLEEKIVKLESEQNSLAQYGRRNNIISGIFDSVDDNNLEITVISMMSDINVNIEKCDIEVCHRLGKPDVILKPRKAIVCFAN